MSHKDVRLSQGGTSTQTAGEAVLRWCSREQFEAGPPAEPGFNITSLYPERHLLPEWCGIQMGCGEAWPPREALPRRHSTSDWEFPRMLSDLGAALWQAGATHEAARAYAGSLKAALEVRGAHVALNAVLGLARYRLPTGEPAAAHTLVARVLADPAGREDTRSAASALYAKVCALLAADEAMQIEAQARDLPLTAILADHASLL
jgi:hypothetical protein